MPENFKKKKEENELIKRFEDHVKNKANHFFELDSFEQIIELSIEPDYEDGHNNLTLTYEEVNDITHSINSVLSVSFLYGIIDQQSPDPLQPGAVRGGFGAIGASGIPPAE